MRKILNEYNQPIIYFWRDSTHDESGGFKEGIGGAGGAYGGTYGGGGDIQGPLGPNGTMNPSQRELADAQNNYNGGESSLQKAVDSVFGSGTYEQSVKAARAAYEANVASTFGLSHDVMYEMGYTQGFGYSVGFGVTQDTLQGPLGPSGTMNPSQFELGISAAQWDIQQNAVMNTSVTNTLESYGFESVLNARNISLYEYTPTMTTMDKIKAAFSSLNGIAQELSNSITGIMEPKSYTMYIDTQPAPYAANAGATAVYEVSKGFFTDTTVTTLTTPNMMGGYDVMRSETGGLTSTGDEVNKYSTNMRGEVVSHITEVSLGNGLSYSYDTHYWSGNNTQFGFAAEMVADMAEYFGANTKTVIGLARAAEVISSFVSTLMPSVQILSAATSIMKINSTIGGLFAIGGLLSVFEELDRLSNMFTGKGFLDAPSNTNYDLSSSLSTVMLGRKEGESSDLGDVVDEVISDDYMLSLLGTNMNNADSSMMPKIYNQTKYIKPTTNQENNMQSQQAVFIDYRGGLSEVLAPNLIGANEGSIFENININKGTMKNKKIGNVVTLNGNLYTIYLPNGYLFTSTFSFNSVRLGNFMYITVDDSLYPYVYQLDYNSLDRDCTLSDLVRVQLDAPTTIPVVADNLVSTVMITLAVDDNDSPEDTSNNVKTGDLLEVYRGDTLIKTSIAITASDISSGLYEVILDDYYPESDEDLFEYRINRSGTIHIPETNELSLQNETELEAELWEEYVYCYTYYNSDSGYESAPIFSDSFLKKTQVVELTNIEYSTDSTVDYIRIYRIGGYSSSYRLIYELANDGTGLTSYTDGCAEEYIPTLLDTQNLAIIEDLKGLIEHKGTLFAFKNNQVYFSRPGKPNMWSNFNSIRVGGVVSGIASTPLGVLIFTENSQTYILGGTDKYNFTLSTLTKTVGCIYKQSINNYKNTAIWLDYEGLMMSVGSSVTNISKEKVNLTDIGDIIECMVYDNVYYLLGTNYTLTVDFKYNQPSFQKLDTFEHILYNKGKIYVYKTDSWYEDAFVDIGVDVPMTYKAPMFIGNSYDILTEFNKIQLTYKGDFTYKIYVDEVEVLSNMISSNKVTVEEIKLPVDDNQGLGLELELIGIGEIKAFRYIFSNVNIN